MGLAVVAQEPANRGKEAARQMSHLILTRFCGPDPRKVKYIARYRLAGFKRYEIVSRHKSKTAAIKAMATAFAAKRDVKRADVLMVELDSYYDPIQICELVRR